MRMDVVKEKGLPELPRFGVRMFVNEKFRNVTYYGMGPYESYIDKHRARIKKLRLPQIKHFPLMRRNIQRRS